MQMDPYSAVIFPESFHNFSTRVFERVPSICSHGACDHLSECSQPSESSSSKTKTFSGHLSDNLTAPLCCAGDNSRVRDDTPGIVLAVGNRPRSNGCLGYPRDASSPEGGQYRADRSTLRYQDSSGAVWDTLCLSCGHRRRLSASWVC